MQTNLVDLEYLCEPSLEPPEPGLCCGEVAPQTSYLTVLVLDLARVVVRVVCWKFCPFKFAVNFLNVLVLSGIFGRDIRCDVNKRFTPRWQEVGGKYQK